jgi:hypothetical protein
MSSSILNKTLVVLFQNSELSSLSSKTRLLSSSPMHLSTNLSLNFKPTKYQLKQEWVQLLLLISQSLLVLQVLIHLKLTSSTPLTSPPKSTKVKSKSPKTSKSVLKARRSKHQKLLYWRSSISSHLSMVSS